MTPRDSESGMILVNVLLFVAIASGLVLLMINREELALDRSLRMREAARAMAIVQGGELSAIVALRRDAREAPQVDHAGEPWAALAETAAPIEGGSFDLAIADAEGRFNINSVRAGDAASVILFETLGREAGLAQEQVIQAIGYVRAFGPVTDLRPLRLAGLDPNAVDRLERMVTALPGQTAINLNAAGPELLTVLFRDAVIADRLVKLRNRAGQLTLKDLSDQSVSQPPGTSLRSNTFWVRARATIGSTSQQEATLIQRRPDAYGAIETVPVARWRNAAVPPGAPAFAGGRTTG
jgi:general secretion pathway protein K